MSQVSHSRGNSGSHIEFPCKQDYQYKDNISVDNESDDPNQGKNCIYTDSYLEETKRPNIDINFDTW